GMSANGVVTQALANATGRTVEVSPVTEATTLGAAFLAGMAAGVWADEADTASRFQPRRVVEPALARDHREELRARWADALDRCGGWVPELSAIHF
ncbi:MAG TPA: FGGY-family carbohydrate kinase, partial [Acidimicrobiia bacterium]|nr:FGGY-family carbohydrate kinase [Acidimicrobiia bacterium]